MVCLWCHFDGPDDIDSSDITHALRWILWIMHEYTTTAAAVCRVFLVTPLVCFGVEFSPGFTGTSTCFDIIDDVTQTSDTLIFGLSFLAASLWHKLFVTHSPEITHPE